MYFFSNTWYHLRFVSLSLFFILYENCKNVYKKENALHCLCLHKKIMKYIFVNKLKFLNFVVRAASFTFIICCWFKYRCVPEPTQRFGSSDRRPTGGAPEAHRRRWLASRVNMCSGCLFWRSDHHLRQRSSF